MLRSTLRIPFHVPEHKGFFVKLLFILDSPTFSGRSDPLHQFEVLAAVARVKRPDKGNVCSPPKCNKKVVCPRGSEQTTAQRRKRMAKVRRHLWPLAITGRGPWAAPSRPARSNPVCRCGGRGGTHPRRRGASWPGSPGPPWKGGYPPNHRRSASDSSGR